MAYIRLMNEELQERLEELKEIASEYDELCEEMSTALSEIDELADELDLSPSTKEVIEAFIKKHDPVLDKGKNIISDVEDIVERLKS